MKTLLTESIPLLQVALAQQVASHPCIKLLQVFHDTKDFFQRVNEQVPDLVWLDGSSTDVRDLSLLKRLRKSFQDLKIIVFGMNDELPEIKNYFKTGIQAYLPKTSPAEEIWAALDSLCADKLFVPATLNKAFVEWVTNSTGSNNRPRYGLSNRENEVLQLIVDEYTSSEIAAKLYLSQCTVECHRINLIQKLGVKNTAGLVRVAFEAGLYNRGIKGLTC